jgi:hypothetical protein
VILAQRNHLVHAVALLLVLQVDAVLHA